MNDLAKLAVFIAGLGSVMYGISAEDMVLRLVFVVPGALAILAVLFLAAGKKRWARKIGFSSGRSGLAAVVVVLIAVAVLVLALKSAGVLTINAPGIEIPGISTGSGEQESEMIALSLPIKFNLYVAGIPAATVLPPLGSGTTIGFAELPAAKPVNIFVYKDNELYETIQVTDYANIVTSQKYESGDRLHIVVMWDVGAFSEADVVVPYVDREVAEIKPPEYHEVDLRLSFAPVSTVTMTILDEAGKQIVDNLTAGTYSIIVSTPEMYVGFPSAAVPVIPGFVSEPVRFVGGIVVTATANVIDIPGARLIYSGPNKYVYYVPVVLANGKAAITLKVLGGSAASVSITAYHALNMDYIQRLGDVNAEAVSVGSISFNTLA